MTTTSFILRKSKQYFSICTHSDTIPYTHSHTCHKHTPSGRGKDRECWTAAAAAAAIFYHHFRNSLTNGSDEPSAKGVDGCTGAVWPRGRGPKGARNTLSEREEADMTEIA